MAGRRTNGDGKLRRRSDGRWECTIMDGYKPNGKRNFKSFYGSTKTEAQKKKNDYLRAKEAGLVVDKEWTFSEFADMWFENHKDNISATTREGYTYTLRILKNGFGRRKLKDIKAYDIEQFLKKLRGEGRSDSYLSKCRAMLFQIFKKAVANDILLKNPVEFADKMRKTDQQRRKESFTMEEVRLMMSKLPQNKIGWSIRLMLGTGMRTQELLSLKPEHISSDGSQITIKSAVVSIKGTVAIGPTKTDSSTRIVQVPPTLMHCARLLRVVNTQYIWEIGKEDSPCNPSYFRDLFKKALSDIEGVRVLTPHCCRHTYVSQMQALGVDMETIKSMVGHADLDMTVHYLHVQKPIQQAAVKKFSEAFPCEEERFTHLELVKSS